MVITRASQNSNFNAIYLKNGTMMYIMFQWLNKTSLATSGNAFWTLSEYYRPKSSYSGYCIAVSSAGAWDPVGLVIETDGSVYHTSSTSRCAILAIVAFEQSS